MQKFSNLLADLSMDFADTKMALADMKEENANLKSQLLKQEKTDKSDLEYIDNIYHSNTNECAYCPTCIDSKNIKIRLTKLPRAFKKLGTFKCNECKSVY